VLAEVGVGVGGAGLGAVVERVDGSGRHAGVDVEGAWAGIQQLPDGATIVDVRVRVEQPAPPLPLSARRR
jgi:hypothetical protein